MKKIIIGTLLAALAAAAPAETGRVTQSFDADWRFLKADAPGAEQPDFADSAWRRLNVPHDWSIEGPFDETNQTGTAGAFLPAGVGWYRKHFTLPEDDSSRRAFIEFDGVMANSDVWINGFHLGKRPFGYASFSYELTGHLNFGGKENVRPAGDALVCGRGDLPACAVGRDGCGSHCGKRSICQHARN
jgi:beta-galactosidase